MRIKISEIKTELQAAILCQEKYIQNLAGDNNPQVARARRDAEHYQEAFKAVLDRLNGDRIAIKLYS